MRAFTILLLMLCCCTKVKYKDRIVEVPIYIEQTDPVYYVKIDPQVCHISPDGFMVFYSSTGIEVGRLDWSDEVFKIYGDTEQSAIEFINILNRIVEFSE